MDQAVSREAGTEQFSTGCTCSPLDCRKLASLLSGLTPDTQCALPGPVSHVNFCVVRSQHAVQEQARLWSGSCPKSPSSVPGGTPQYFWDGDVPCGRGNTEPHRVQCSGRKEIHAQNFDPCSLGVGMGE